MKKYFSLLCIFITILNAYSQNYFDSETPFSDCYKLPIHQNNLQSNMQVNTTANLFMPQAGKYFEWDTLNASWNYRYSLSFFYDQFGRDTLTYSIDTTNSNSVNYRCFIGYNPQGQIIERLWQTYDSITHIYTNVRKLIVTFDSYGNYLSYITYTWDNGSWQIYQGYQMVLTYDSLPNPNVICAIEQHSFGTQAFINFSKDSMQHGANNEIIQLKHYENSSALVIQLS